MENVPLNTERMHQDENKNQKQWSDAPTWEHETIHVFNERLRRWLNHLPHWTFSPLWFLKADAVLKYSELSKYKPPQTNPFSPHCCWNHPFIMTNRQRHKSKSAITQHKQNPALRLPFQLRFVCAEEPRAEHRTASGLQATFQTRKTKKPRRRSRRRHWSLVLLVQRDPNIHTTEMTVWESELTTLWDFNPDLNPECAERTERFYFGMKHIVSCGGT